MKIVSIHQPSYWPWLGLLDKIAKAGTFILLDDAQVVKGTFQYRNIFFCNGEAKFITIPIKLKLGMNFNEITFSNDKWKTDHLNRFYNYYQKAPYYKVVYPELERFFDKRFERPIDLLRESMLFCFDKLEINTEILLSSKFNVNGTKGDMVLNLCNSLGADVYIAGRGSYEYMQKYLAKFQEEEIAIEWHTFKHPVYDQHPRFPFLEGLSCLDIFFFNGYDRSRKIFWENINKNG